MSRRKAIEKNGIFDLRKHIFNREIGSKTNRFTFQSDLNLHRLENLSLSRHRDVKVVGHGAITSVAIDPLEWRYILAGSSDGLVAIYDTKNSSGSPRHVSEVVGITSNSGGLSRASTSVVQWYPTDNAVFVSSGADGQLKVWDANHLTQPVESFILSKRIYCHHIAKLNSSQVAVGTDTNHVKLVDLRSGASTHELRGHKNSILAVQWSPNLPSILASGCLDGKALLWDVRKARNCLMSFDMGNIQGKEKKRSLEKSMAHKGSLNGLTFSNTSRHLVTYGCCDGRVRKWDIMTGINTKTKFDPYNNISKMMDIKIHVPIVTSEKTTSTSEEVVFVPNKSNIIRMRLEDGLCRGRLTGHFKSVTGLAFSPMHLELFSGSSDRAILVWDAQNLGAFEENLAEKNVKEPDRITVDAWSSSSSSEDES